MNKDVQSQFSVNISDVFNMSGVSFVDELRDVKNVQEDSTQKYWITRTVSSVLFSIFHLSIFRKQIKRPFA